MKVRQYKYITFELESKCGRKFQKNWKMEPWSEKRREKEFEFCPKLHSMIWLWKLYVDLYRDGSLNKEIISLLCFLEQK